MTYAFLQNYMFGLIDWLRPDKHRQCWAKDKPSIQNFSIDLLSVWVFLEADAQFQIARVETFIS